MKKSIFNCVYYWTGGTEVGNWNQADLGTEDAIRKGGRIAIPGNTKIGPPEDTPTEAELAQVI